jgi:hypothetical protein
MLTFFNGFFPVLIVLHYVMGVYKINNKKISITTYYIKEPLVTMLHHDFN